MQHMNISMNNSPFSILSQHFGSGLKSTEEKAERQKKAQSQIDFFENRKAGLKNMQCETLDEIAQKLELFNTYEDQIAEVKKRYNQEQMMHCMDEAKERGEKIAEAAKELEPKTAEERREELAKEALGIEDGGMLTEMLEDTPQEEALDEMLADGEMQFESAQSIEELPEIVEQEKLTREYLERQYVPIDIKA